MSPINDKLAPGQKRKYIPSGPMFKSNNTGGQSPESSDIGRVGQIRATSQLYMPLVHLSSTVLKKEGRTVSCITSKGIYF